MRVTLRRGKDKALRGGYPWVFANQIAGVDGAPATGDVVEIAGADGTVYGRGFYHADSLIAVRFLTRDLDAAIDGAFFHDRLARALRLREAAFPGERHYRLAFAEADGLPGTVVDRYGDVLSWSTLAYGMDARRELLLDALEALVGPRAIVERNDVPLRAKDGLPQRQGVVRGADPGPVRLEEDGVVFDVDVVGGPKTGFFLDQRLHRRVVRRFAPGRRVLDVFSADGGFGLHAAAAGAAAVHLMDSSEPALARARANAEASGLADRITTEAADALDRLEVLADAGTSYDLIVLDPPAFAKSRRHVDAALKAYQRININAFRMLPPGGVLATASCSQAVSEDDFLKAVRYSARKAEAPLRLLYRGTQPPDHPVLDAMPETHYLKFYVFGRLGDEVPLG